MFLVAAIQQGVSMGRRREIEAEARKSRNVYCCRRDYGTRMMERTGNLKAVMKVMGHRDVKMAMKYQHPSLKSCVQHLITAVRPKKRPRRKKSTAHLQTGTPVSD